MPLLLIVRKGKKLGSFLSHDSLTFMSDLGYQIDTPVYVKASSISGYSVMAVSHALIPNLELANGMLVTEAVPAYLGSSNILNLDSVSYFLAIKPEEKQLLQDVTKLKFKAVLIDSDVLSQDIVGVSDKPVNLTSVNVGNALGEQLSTPMYVVSVQSNTAPMYKADAPLALRDTGFNLQSISSTRPASPAYIKNLAYIQADIDVSCISVLTSKRDLLENSLVSSSKALLMPDSVLDYTIHWIPPIPVRIWESEANNALYEASALAIKGPDAQLGSVYNIAGSKQFLIKGTSYSGYKTSTDKGVLPQSRTFNSAIKVEVLHNLTGIVNSVAYSLYSVVLSPTLMPTVSASSTANYGVLLPTADLSVATSITYSAIGNPPALSGLVALYDVGNAQSYWPSTTSTLNDLTSNANAMTLSATSYVTGDSLTCAGTGYGLAASTTANSLTTAVSLEAVIKPTALASATYYMGILSKGTSTDGATASYELLLVQSASKNYLMFRIYNKASVVCSPKLIEVPLNTISHVVATYDGSTLNCYVNSVRDGSPVASSGNLQTNTGGLCLGARFLHKGVASRSGFLGNIYQARVYNRAISQEEIVTNFNGIRTRYGI